MAHLRSFLTRSPGKVVLAICLAWPTLLSAQSYTQAQYLDMIEAYVDKLQNIYDGTWAYSYTNHDKLDAESITRRIDPSLPFVLSERIIAENGGPPSAQTLASHERRMQRRLRRSEGGSTPSLEEEEEEREGNEKERFLNLLIRDSVKLVSQEGDLHTLEFRGMEEARRSIYEHLVGTLILDTRNEYIRELQIRVSKPFSPFIVMRINDGNFSLRFELKDGYPVQTDATWQLDGHILYLRDLNRDQELEWFDMEKVGGTHEGI
jgi:hypothetical protein